MPSESVDRLPRCCPRHESWSELTSHLIDDFPMLSATDVVTQVSRARDVVSSFALGADDHLATAEVLVRHQLLLLSGQLPDSARLDPEVHDRRSGQAEEFARR